MWTDRGLLCVHRGRLDGELRVAVVAEARRRPHGVQPGPGRRQGRHHHQPKFSRRPPQWRTLSGGAGGGRRRSSSEREWSGDDHHEWTPVLPDCQRGHASRYQRTPPQRAAPGRLRPQEDPPPVLLKETQVHRGERDRRGRSGQPDYWGRSQSHIRQHFANSEEEGSHPHAVHPCLKEGGETLFSGGGRMGNRPLPPLPLGAGSVENGKGFCRA